MVIDQRNVGASIALPDGATNYSFPVDRFFGARPAAGTATGQQVSDAPTGFVNSFKWTTGTASGGSSEWAYVGQQIEGYNIADLNWGTANAKTITLSFWVKSSLTGQFGGSLANSGSSRSYPFTYTISVANTWEQKSITIAGDTSGTWLTTNGRGISLYFDLGNGSTLLGPANAWASTGYYGATGDTKVANSAGATWYLTGVQFEVGSQATSFDFRDFTRELQMCQRYFQKAVPLDVVPGVGTGLYTSGAVYAPVNTSTSQAMWSGRFPVQMRAAPAMAIWNSNNSTANQAWSEITQTNLAFSISGTTMNGLGFGANPTATGINGNIFYITYTASAEL